MPAVKGTTSILPEGEGGTSSPRYNPMARPLSRAASESGLLPPPSPHRSPRSASASPRGDRAPDMDTAPDKVPTPPTEWPIERLTSKLLSCLSTRHLRDIEKFGPPALWESLHEGGFGDEYELFNELCNIAFPLYQPLSAAQAEDTATHMGIVLINQARSTPPAPSTEEEPVTPKGPTTTRKPHFEVPDPEVMNIDNVDPDQTESNTQRRAAQLLKRGLALITQLHKLWTAAAEIQGDAAQNLLEAIRISFHLQGGDPDTPTRLTTRGTTHPTSSLTSHAGPSNPATNIIHAPQPTRPISLQMPASRTPRPTRPPRDRTPYTNKGKARQRSQTPPSSKGSSPRPSSTKSYASKAALSAKETLTRAQEVLSKAPSLSLDEAMAVARSLPITPTPKPNNRKSATIQGSRESSCIISTGVLLHQGIIERIQDLILEDQQLALLPVRNIAVSNDRRSIILRSNQTLIEDDIHAFRTLIANATNQPYDECLPTNRPTYSTAKIEFLPINNSITTETIHNALMHLDVYAEHHTTNGVQLIPHPTNKLVQTALVKIFDYRNGALLKRLCHESVTIGTDTRRLKPWVNKPMARQCSICQKWGHAQQICRSQQAVCTICAEFHPTSAHHYACGRCHAANVNPQHCSHLHCANCDGPHEATNTSCPWFTARTNPNEIKRLHEAKRNTTIAQRSAHQAHSSGSQRSLPQRIGPRAPGATAGPSTGPHV
ncbi:hypothetical protein AX15_005514 [Amanita polypyramis BW_CC]|nr:hypothetical protein AX15_005514 [Amanita polypyramis BW_CC]